MQITRRINGLEKKLNPGAVGAFLALAVKENVDLRPWQRRLAALKSKVGITPTFVGYVHDFYGPKGIYDMGATVPQIEAATALMMGRHNTNVADDSVDRERVRDILISEFGLVFPK
jgi:hypothetical protein